MTAKHTPTPWEASEGYIFRGKDCIVNCETDAVSPKTEAANAAFIARAVNAHDDLVTALKAVIRVADRKTVEFDLARAALAKAASPD